MPGQSAAEEKSLEHFIELETKVWDALVSGDMQADAALLTDDFLGVYATGFSDRAAHVKQLENGPTVDKYEIRDAQLLPLSDSLVMLAYLAIWTPAGAEIAGLTEKMYVSSLWRRDGSAWKNVFSQDTPVPANAWEAVS